MQQGRRTPQPPGLMKAVRERFENEVFSAPNEAVKQLGCVLVCDDWSLSILECIYKVNDLTRHGVPLVENLSNGRQFLARNPVIYLCQCTAKNISLIINDWTPSKDKGWKAKPYAEAHVFFTSQVKSQYLRPLQEAKVLTSHLKTLKSLSVEFLAVEPHLFNLQIPNDLSFFFSKAKGDTEEITTRIAHQLMDVILTMGDTVSIRHQKGGKCAASHLLATTLSKVQSERIDMAVPPSTSVPLLVLDRSLDCIGPLLHELTYQAMLADQPPDNSSVKLKFDESVPTRATVTMSGDGPQSKSSLRFDEDNEIWCRMRHSHIADNGDVLSKELNELVSNSKALNIRKQNASEVTTTQISAAIQETPHITAQIKSYKAHIELHRALMNLMTKCGLDTVCDLEQTLATHEAADGTKIDKEGIKKNLDEYMNSVEPSNTYTNKLRLLLLYIITQGPVSGDRQTKWIQGLNSTRCNGNASWEKNALITTPILINNLSQLDVTTEKKKWYQVGKTKKKKGKSESTAYDWSRYISPLRTMAEHLVTGSLSEAECPHVLQEEPSREAVGSTSTAGRKSLRTRDGAQTRSQWGASLRNTDAKSTSSSNTATTFPSALPWSLTKCKNRVYIFVIGGITYAESRAIAEVISDKEVEVIVGSTSLGGYRSFLSSLSEL